MSNKNNYKLIPVTFSISGYVKVYGKESLEKANEAVLSDPEAFAPVDTVDRLSFSEMDYKSLQYVDGSMEASFKDPEEIRQYKLCLLTQTLMEKDAIINAQTGIIYIPDISLEPFWFHGFNVKQLGEKEIKEAIETFDNAPLSQYCFENYPAAGSLAPDRLGYIPLDLDEKSEESAIRDAIMDFLNHFPAEEIDSLMREDDFVDMKRKDLEEKEQEKDEDKPFELVLHANDWVYTPRFCTVQIKEVFETEAELRKAGYKDPTYFESLNYVVYGKSLDMFHMEFAAARK